MQLAPSFTLRAAASVVIVISGLVLSGCESESGTGTVHPVESRIPQFDDPDRIIQTVRDSTGGAMSKLRTALRSPSWTVGTRDGRAPERFAEIGDVVEDAQGRVLVLDNEHREVRLFTPDGAYVGAFGREGEAPGEFQYPADIDRLSDGTIMVVGRMGRIQFFESADSTYERTGGFRVKFTPEDACVMDDTIYLHGMLAKQARNSIHAYTRAGKRVTSFGPVYEDEKTVVRHTVSDGSIACDDFAQTVAFAFNGAGMVYGYDPSGTRTGVSRLEPFNPMPREEETTDDGRPRMRHRFEPGTDLLVGLTDVPGEGLIAQRQRFPPEETDEAATGITTYWLSAENGTGAYVGEGTLGGPAAGPIAHVSPTHLFSVRSVPFPRVDAYDARDVKWKRISRSDE